MSNSPPTPPTPPTPPKPRKGYDQMLIKSKKNGKVTQRWLYYKKPKKSIGKKCKVTGK